MEETFRKMSATLTGFSEADIQGTGLTDAYAEAIQHNLTEALYVELLTLFTTIEAETKTPEALNQQLRHQVFASPKFGPMARNIMMLWYTGTWSSMPTDWVTTYGPIGSNQSCIISSQSYLNGLVWDAVGAHPMGGKQEGFASWSFDPPNYPA